MPPPVRPPWSSQSRALSSSRHSTRYGVHARLPGLDCSCIAVGRLQAPGRGCGRHIPHTAGGLRHTATATGHLSQQPSRSARPSLCNHVAHLQPPPYFVLPVHRTVSTPLPPHTHTPPPNTHMHTHTQHAPRTNRWQEVPYRRRPGIDMSCYGGRSRAHHDVSGESWRRAVSRPAHPHPSAGGWRAGYSLQHQRGRGQPCARRLPQRLRGRNQRADQVSEGGAG